MPTVTLKVGPMSVTTDTDKVAHKYAIKAPEQMIKAAGDTIQTSKELKAIQSKRTERTPSAPHSTRWCSAHAMGSRASRADFPQSSPRRTSSSTDGKEDAVSGNITGNATTIGGTTDRDVADCVAAAVDTTINKSVVAGIKDHIDKNP